MSQASAVIVGAGVAGLIAAHTLEAAGHAPLVIDRDDRAGGRLKTDEYGGFRLDSGFQVLLTDYPEVQRYLDLEALQLGKFRPGGHVHTRQLDFRFADPLREPAQLFRSLLSPVGTLADKIHLARLGLKLRTTSFENCFAGYESTKTIDYLWEYGFSEQIVERFFRPFFGGIFLEQELRTPASLFRYVLKLFSTGAAALPAEGIEAVARQLVGRLERTTFRFGTEVREVNGKGVLLAGGERIEISGGTIVACEPTTVLPQLASSSLGWKSTTNLYFYSTRRLRENRLINLVSDPTSTINTYCVLDEVVPTYKLDGQGGSLISVTLKYPLPIGGSIAQAEQDLLRHTRLPNDALSFVRRYDVRKALPDLDRNEFAYAPTQSRLTDRIFLAGDHQLNGSLDAAMRSGRLAAEGLLRTGAL